MRATIVRTPGTDLPQRRRAPRWWRAFRGLLVGLVALVVAVTLASYVFNAVTVPRASLPAPDGADITVGGTRVHYRQWGSHGSPVVLVHGFAESTAAWGPTAERLAKDHVVYALDLAGYGYTQYTGHYTLNDEVALVDGFIRTLGLDRPVLVGHSMGAAVVGGVALRDPAAVGGIIFADGDALPFSGDSAGAHRPGWILRTPYFLSAYRLLTGSDSFGERIIASQCGSQCRVLTPAIVAAWMRPMRQGDAEAALAQLAGAGVLHLTPDQIRAIRVPRAIIWGAEDARSGGSLADAQRYLGDPPTLVIPGAAHLSMLADPAGFAADVDQLAAAMSATG